MPPGQGHVGDVSGSWLTVCTWPRGILVSHLPSSSGIRGLTACKEQDILATHQQFSPESGDAVSPREHSGGFGEGASGQETRPLNVRTLLPLQASLERGPGNPESSRETLGSTGRGCPHLGLLRQAAPGSLRLGRALARILEIWVPVSLLDLGKSLCHLASHKRRNWCGAVGRAGALESGPLGLRSRRLGGLGQIT